MVFYHFRYQKYFVFSKLFWINIFCGNWFRKKSEATLGTSFVVVLKHERIGTNRRGTKWTGLKRISEHSPFQNYNFKIYSYLCILVASFYRRVCDFVAWCRRVPTDYLDRSPFRHFQLRPNWWTFIADGRGKKKRN